MSEIEDIYQEIMPKLRSLQGDVWKEAQGEIHLHYKEMPFWILLFEGSDLSAVHHEFARIVEPYVSRLEDIEMTVAYREFTPDGQRMIFHDFLESSSAILRGEGDWPLGSMPSEEAFSGSSVFSSRDSRRPGSKQA